MLALTKQRVILASGAFFLGGNQSIRVSDVATISSGLNQVGIEVTNGNHYVFDFWPTKMNAAKAFVQQIYALQSGAAAEPARPPMRDSSVADELSKLARLPTREYSLTTSFRLRRTHFLPEEESPSPEVAERPAGASALRDEQHWASVLGC